VPHEIVELDSALEESTYELMMKIKAADK